MEIEGNDREVAKLLLIDMFFLCLVSDIMAVMRDVPAVFRPMTEWLADLPAASL
jgi:hypothetical protein